MTWKEATGRKKTSVKVVCVMLVIALLTGTAAASAETGDTAYVASVGDSMYASVTEAAAEANGSVVKLLADSQETVTVSGDLYLDLNGYKLAALTITDGTLYGMDSTTDDYDCSDGYGTILSFTGSYETAHKSEIDGEVKRYLTVEQDEAVSFHRVYLGITHASLRPANAGVGYKAVFAGDEMVQAQLHETEAFGYTLQLKDFNPVSRWKAAAEFVSEKTVTLRLKNYDELNYGEADLRASVQLKLSDGTLITSENHTDTLRTMIETVNAQTDAYSTAQLEALAAWVKSSETMLTWEVENILNPNITYYTVTFTDYDGTTLAASKVKAGADAVPPADPTKSGTTFLGWSGNYLDLTQDETVKAVYSDEKNVLRIGSVTASAGDTVTLLVEVTGAVKICGFDCSLFYDPNLELVTYDEDLDLDVVANDAAYTNGIKMNFTATSDKTKQRDIIELTFKIKDGSQGALPITLQVHSIKEIISNNPLNTEYVVVNGVVTVQ